MKRNPDQVREKMHCFCPKVLLAAEWDLFQAGISWDACWQPAPYTDQWTRGPDSVRGRQIVYLAARRLKYPVHALAQVIGTNWSTIFTSLENHDDPARGKMRRAARRTQLVQQADSVRVSDLRDVVVYGRAKRNTHEDEQASGARRGEAGHAKDRARVASAVED